MTERVTISRADLLSIQEASFGVAYLGTLLRYAGAYAQNGDGPGEKAVGLHLSELGGAVKWAGEQMDRFAADIDNAVCQAEAMP